MIRSEPAHPEAPRARVALALLAVTAVAAALRFTALGAQSFWYDEAVSADLARAPILDLLAGRARDLGNPPLYPALLALWTSVFGTGDAALRALSAAAGVACVPLAYAVVRRLTADARVALVAAALLAVSPFHVYLAQEARTFALLTLLGLASILALLRAAERPRSVWRWAAYAAATFAALYAHYFALFLVPAGFLVLAARGALRRAVLAPYALALVAAALPYLTWLPALADQLHTSGNLARSAESWHLQVAATPLAYAVGTTLVWKGEDAWAGGLALAAIATLAACAAALAALLRRDTRRPALALLAWLAPSILFPILISTLVSPLYHVRYVALVAPAFYGLVALGAIRAGPRLRGALAAALLVPAAVSIARYEVRTVKHDWRSTVTAVERIAGPEEPLVFDAGFNETSFAHYATGPQPRLRVIHPAQPGGALTFVRRAAERPDPLAPVLEQADRFWLVLSDAAPGADAAWAPTLADRQTDAELRFRGIRALRLVRRPPEIRPAVAPELAPLAPAASAR